MSRVFNKLKEVSGYKNNISRDSVTVEPGPVFHENDTHSPVFTKQSSIMLLIAIVVGIATAFFFVNLSSNVSRIKNDLLLNMDTIIKKQQNEISILNKNIIVMHASDAKAIKRLNKNMQSELAEMDTKANDKFDQANNERNRMEAILQANIDELNAKVSKLQATITASQNTPTQTNTTASAN